MGNWLEWYEFAIFGFLIKPISYSFFPSTSPFLATLMSYGIFACGFIMRPLGALFCGYIGDRKGRKAGLLYSVAFMAIPTFMMGLLPTYEQIGILSPLLLLLCRLFQGLSVGGEFSGSVVCLIEHAPLNRQGIYGSWADLGSAFGMITASLTVIFLTTSLTESQLTTWGWRLPFLLAILFGFVGYYLRKDLCEPRVYTALTSQQKPKNPLKHAFQMNPLVFILSITFLAINAGGYYFLIIYLPQQLGERFVEDSFFFSHHISSLLPLVSLVFMIPATTYGAFLSDRIGQVPCLLFGYTGTLILIFPLIYVNNFSTVWHVFIFYILFAFSLGFCYGPRSSFMTKFFPVQVRCSAISVTYNISNAIFGGFSPFLCTWMSESFDFIYASGIFITCLSIISLASVLLLSKSSHQYEKVIPVHV